MQYQAEIKISHPDEPAGQRRRSIAACTGSHLDFAVSGNPPLSPGVFSCRPPENMNTPAWSFSSHLPADLQFPGPGSNVQQQPGQDHLAVYSEKNPLILQATRPISGVEAKGLWVVEYPVDFGTATKPKLGQGKSTCVFLRTAIPFDAVEQG